MPYRDDYTYTVINASGLTVVSSKKCVYGGFRVLAAAGAFNMDIFDNASAASGQKLEPTTSVNTPANGILVTGIVAENGLVVNMSGDPTDALILVFWQ